MYVHMYPAQFHRNINKMTRLHRDEKHEGFRAYIIFIRNTK